MPHRARPVREGQGVVAEGVVDAAGVFRADTLLAKHDEKYMPKEVADALEGAGAMGRGHQLREEALMATPIARGGTP